MANDYPVSKSLLNYSESRVGSVGSYKGIDLFKGIFIKEDIIALPGTQLSFGMLF